MCWHFFCCCCCPKEDKAIPTASTRLLQSSHQVGQSGYGVGGSGSSSVSPRRGVAATPAVVPRATHESVASVSSVAKASAAQQSAAPSAAVHRAAPSDQGAVEVLASTPSSKSALVDNSLMRTPPQSQPTKGQVDSPNFELMATP